MVAIPRYVATPTEAAARIAGFAFGDGNPEHIDPQLGDTITALATTGWTRNECIRCAGVIGWTLGTHYRLPANGNFIFKTDAIHTALGRPLSTSIATEFYHMALAPYLGFVPTRQQVQAFMASVIETEGQAGTHPSCKVFDEARGLSYEDRIDNLVIMLNTQSLNSTRVSISTRVPVADLDNFGMPLISAARYPGIEPANWPDGSPPPPDVTPPPVPIGLVALAGDEQVSLSWGTVVAADLAGYRGYRDGVQVYQGTLSAFLDTGRSNGVTYSYRVSSYDTTGNESALTSAVLATPEDQPNPPPNPPTALNGVATSSTVSLTWVASTSEDIVAYQVYRGVVLVTTVTGTAYVDTGLDANTVYTYQVVAVDADDLLAATAPISVTTLIAVVPPPVIDLVEEIARLGCPEDYVVYVCDRSGDVLLRELPFTGLTWDRRVDDVSSANIRMDLANIDADCCEAVEGLRRYGYEIRIDRDGRRVWTGPLIDKVFRGPTIELRADDKMHWPKRRIVRQEMSWPEPGVDASEVFNWVIAHAMQSDNVPGLFSAATATGIAVVRDIKVNPPEVAFEIIDEISRTAIDWTMVGPVLIAGSFVIPTPPTAYITEQALAVQPDIDELGSNFAGLVHVTGDPDQNLLGSYGGIDPVVGLVESIFQEDSINDQGSLTQNAKTRWELLSANLIPDVTFTLSQEAPLPISLAVPGAVLDVRLAETCVTLIGRFRIKKVEVDVSVSDKGLDETVKVTCEAVGTEVVT